jgi:hypothetical protein
MLPEYDLDSSGSILVARPKSPSWVKVRNVEGGGRKGGPRKGGREEPRKLETL